MEVEVFARAGKFVEARDARLEVGGELGANAHAAILTGVFLQARVDVRGEFLQRGALDDMAVIDAGWHDPAGVFLARRKVLRALVPDRSQDKGRELRGGAIPLEEFLGELSVKQRLVDYAVY